MLSTVCEAPVSELFPHIFRIHRPIADGDSPLIAAGSMLTVGEVHVLSVANGLVPRWDEKSGLLMYGALAGQSLIKRLLEADASEHYKLLWSPCKETAAWIGTCMESDTLHRLLEVFSLTKFGNARVEGPERSALVSLADALELLREGTLRTDIALSAVGSTRIEIDSQAPVKEAASAMIKRGVRRLFVKGRDGEFVSSRSILRHLFSAERLFLARDRPEEWLSGGVSDLRPSKAVSLPVDRTARDAARAMGNLPDDCVLTDDGKVVSRWDLLVKPWKAGRLF